MRVYLDDRRTTPPGWIRCYTPEEVIILLKHGDVYELSLDHDLGLPPDEKGREVSGYNVLLWLEERIVKGEWTFRLPVITIHSDNGPGRDRMISAVQSIEKRFAENVRKSEQVESK